MSVQKVTAYEVDLVLVGGVHLQFMARRINVTPDGSSYIFNSDPGEDHFTIFEPVAKSDIAFLSARQKHVFVQEGATPEPEEVE